MPFPIEQRFVKQTEEKLGRALPVGYVVRMCQSNGGGIRTDTDYFELHPILDTTDRKRLARTCNDILRETKSACERPDFPSGALVIGNNGGGDLLVLLPDPVAPRYAEAVYWWDHETGEINWLADTFEDLR